MSLIQAARRNTITTIKEFKKGNEYTAVILKEKTEAVISYNKDQGGFEVKHTNGRRLIQGVFASRSDIEMELRNSGLCLGTIELSPVAVK